MKKILALLMVFAAISVMICHTGNAQMYKFQQYNTDKGLCYQFVYSITQDKHGFIWFATGMGLCRYDGFRFSSVSDDLPSSNVSTTFRDDRGNLWFGYNDGLIVKYDGIEFSIADTSINKKEVTQIIQAPKGEILATTQTGGITRIDRKIDRLTDGFEDIYINALCFSGNDKLLVGTYDGLYLYEYGNEQQTPSLVGSIEELSYLPVKSIIPKVSGNGYWVATDDAGIFHVTVGENRFSTFRLDIPELEDVQVQSVYEDTQGALWISTFGKGLIRVFLSEQMNVIKTTIYNNSNGLGSDNVKQVYIDNQQNLWVATYGQGVVCINYPVFSFFEAMEPVGNNATAIFSVDNSEYWIAGTGALIRITTQPEPKRTIFRRADGLPDDRITALRTDQNGDLWIGTEKSGLYKLAKDAKRFLPFYSEENSLSNAIQNFIFADDRIWMATRNGVLIIDQKTGRKTTQYDTYDGELPHNNIRDIFKDSKNRIWIATNSNSLIDIRNRKRLTVPNQAETEFSVIAEDEQGRIWAGTYGKGVYLFDETRDTIYQFTTNEELFSDFCYAIASDDNGHIWIGHRQGLTNINTKRLTINTFDRENSIYGDVNPLAMQLNKSGEMLIGMTDGVLMFDINNDQPRDVVPMLNLSQVLINDKPYNCYEPVVLPPGRYKVQFDFVGLQYANPTSVSYQYLLQGYDDDVLGWSSLSKSTIAIYPRLEDGEYSFWVKACNSDTCTEQKMLFTIKIRNPFYKTWWFVLLMIAAILGLGYIVIMIRERKQRILQEYLENELKARTREVRKQKEEIEVKNRDITDSINYAQRIQFSVLPSTSTLLEHCSGAFIFYRPRDIVSGDFYWFDYFPQNNRLLVVCADSTGHGVPGAFMSLIGTTLIKDIAMRSEVLDPAEILYSLDKNVQSTLNQNRDSEQANDGMDIIVCEINTETHFTKIASAMRPYIVYHDGAPTVYKSSRASIGGQYLENKAFHTDEMQLSKGDSIYMFTDGYTDQFGGPSGKKLKMNRLQNILNDIHTRDMDEQYRVIKDNFDLWKGHASQIDDVLMIGVKI